MIATSLYSCFVFPANPAKSWPTQPDAAADSAVILLIEVTKATAVGTASPTKCREPYHWPWTQGNQNGAGCPRQLRGHADLAALNKLYCWSTPCFQRASAGFGHVSCLNQATLSNFDGASLGGAL